MTEYRWTKVEEKPMSPWLLWGLRLAIPLAFVVIMSAVYGLG